MEKHVIYAAVILTALVATGVLFVYLQPHSSPSISEYVSTNASGGYSQEPAVVVNGDTVQIDYTLFTEDGSVYDTSIESVARASGIYKEGLTYKPLSFKVGAGSVIKGIEKAVLGMRVGEEKNVSIPPEDAYGEYNTSLLAVMPRFYTVERIEVVPLRDFLTAFPDFDFSANETISFGSWDAELLAVSNESVTLRHNPELNASIPTGSWIDTVVDVNDSYITLRHDPVVGRQYIVRDVEGKPSVATVRDVKDDYLLLDYNPPLAGQTLNFTIKLVNIIR